MPSRYLDLDSDIGNNSFGDLRDPADFNAGYGVSVVVVVVLFANFLVLERVRGRY